MKIFLEEHRELSDTQVQIKYPKLTKQIRQIETVLYVMNRSIAGKHEGNFYQLNPMDIYYIESVDKRTYIYGEKTVYETNARLYQLEEELRESGFVRISKRCIVNQYMLKGIKLLPNSHIEASLVNGEILMVTRNYIAGIRRALERK